MCLVLGTVSKVQKGAMMGGSRSGRLVFGGRRRIGSEESEKRDVRTRARHCHPRMSLADIAGFISQSWPLQDLSPTVQEQSNHKRTHLGRS